MACSHKKCLEKAAIAFFATVQIEGKKSVERQIEYYNLDAIILVGYRVNSMSFLAKRVVLWYGSFFYVIPAEAGIQY
jgi:hypothetical protein